MVGGWAEAAGAGGALVVAAVAGRNWVSLRRRSRLLAVARDVTARYARLLTVKRQQLVIHDGYGNYQLQPWIDHIDYFIENVVLREARDRGLDTRGMGRGTPTRSRLIRTLLATLREGDDAVGSAPIRDADIISGEHYETLCRNLLQAQGWQVETTPVTGDQGADLIADAEGCRVVIQCKFYSKPVGNKAVQEAHAAVGFHAGDRAAVVSNASFTRSAKQLAAANGVLLLHHDQLADLGQLLRRA
ncbi:restriction endonuclease [Lichenibacterium minor]|uniref:Restriction endonuclease n=1 Tax=Lichenibacterium minor TaxID=2316528 RepID=A0A4Q2UEI5_9HYPH|nr:restriction endonuclease [Lichenibacterium minor]RYC33225.1 restriction endonuclease [Lichenibacterium minor]